MFSRKSRRVAGSVLFLGNLAWLWGFWKLEIDACVRLLSGARPWREIENMPHYHDGGWSPPRRGTLLYKMVDGCWSEATKGKLTGQSSSSLGKINAHNKTKPHGIRQLFYLFTIS